MNCIIVDDNLMARMAMRKLIEQVKEISLVAECENAMAAYNIVNQKPVDVLFLDIEMPGMTGIELTKNLKNKSPFIIFTTAKMMKGLLFLRFFESSMPVMPGISMSRNNTSTGF